MDSLNVTILISHFSRLIIDGFFDIVAIFRWKIMPSNNVQGYNFAFIIVGTVKKQTTFGYVTMPPNTYLFAISFAVIAILAFQPTTAYPALQDHPSVWTYDNGVFVILPTTNRGTKREILMNFPESRERTVSNIRFSVKFCIGVLFSQMVFYYF